MNADAWRLLGDTYSKANRSPQAITAYLKADEIQPQYFKNYQELGSFYFRRGDYDNAARSYKRETELAPDLIVGYCRGFRNSWESSGGELTQEIYSPNTNAWSADHCIDALEVPGILFANRSLSAQNPALVDIAPSILAEFGLPTPTGMTGRNVFST